MERIDFLTCLDFNSGQAIREASVSPLEFERLVSDRFSNFVLIFNDGLRDLAFGRAGAGYYVSSLDYRFGIRLSSFSSVLSVDIFHLLRT